MFFHGQFEEFNPVSDYVSSSPFSSLPTIADRARDLLKSRTLEQILIIAQSVGKLIDWHFEYLEYCAIDELKSSLLRYATEFGASDELDTFFEWDGGSNDNGQWLFKKSMTDQLDVLTAENSNVVDALKARIEDWDDEDPKEDPNEQPEGKNHEFFAVLALLLIADSQKWHSKYKSTSIAGESAIQAMDAVCHAEHLQRKASFKECLLRYKADEEKSNLKKIHSERGRNGAIEKNKTMRILEQWTLKQYDAGSWKTGNKAACELKEKVLAHGKAIEAYLSPANAQRTIAEWINKHRARIAARPTR
ncbi:hypothetical protein [Gallionella capsiferriformans]|uniref:Uncharacterized protein n=1 Tax=Gallionella capsiferriformans (strain ES-2) TaxID=395494 RepID=D9SHV4_GALCS|nr:hypothetical protein [Gallionella capsiferriformans]ADL56044.1 hypothetical protein Galf_2038 [Gallionella capsiferriformans ES-2]